MNGFELSSANSINWGRLVRRLSIIFRRMPTFVKSEENKLGDKINFAVPTGNFRQYFGGILCKTDGSAGE